MSQLFDVSGKSIVIAGAGGGIGSQLSKFFYEHNAQLTLCDSDSEKLSATSAQLLNTATCLPVDIRSADDCKKLMKHAQETYGRIDVVINAVGVLPIEEAATMNADQFSECLDLNVTGALILSQSAKEYLPSGGSIIHIASVSSLVSNIGYAAYSASKAALTQLIKVLAREWAPDNIRVNAIGPALIETPLTSGYLANTDFRRNAIDSIPMKRLATVEDIHGTVLLLSSSASLFITGQTIYIDGGRTLV